jgi:hypothetical protein
MTPPKFPAKHSTQSNGARKCEPDPLAEVLSCMEWTKVLRAPLPADDCSFREAGLAYKLFQVYVFWIVIGHISTYRQIFFSARCMMHDAAYTPRTPS